MATVRRELIINHPAELVWDVIGDPTSLDRWFPGIASCDYETSDQPGVIGIRHVTTDAGLSLTEEIITLDRLLRRMQYRIAGGVIAHHLATIDVIALDDDRCLAVYGTDARPDVMSLILGGASEEALHNVSDLLDGASDTNSASDMDGPSDTDGASDTDSA